MKRNGSKQPAPAGDDKTVAVVLTGAVRKRLKMYAASRELTIKAVVNAALDDYLKRNGA